MNAIEAIIHKSRDLAVIKNSESKKHVINQGVLFGKYIDDRGDVCCEAWVVTVPCMVRWSDFGNVDFPEDKPWFSYSEGGFVENECSFDVHELRKIWETRVREVDEMAIDRHKAEVFPIPIVNVLDRMANIYDGENVQKIERSRTIIKNNFGFVFEDELILTFDKERDMFYHPEMTGVEFYPHKDSNLKGGFEHEMKYRTVMVEEPEEGVVILVDVRDIYFKGIELGIHEVFEGTYFPDSERDVIDFANYPEDRVIRYPYLMDPPADGYTFSPIHVESPALFYTLRIMEGYTYALMHVANDSRLKPFLLRGVKEGEAANMPTIEILMGPLKPEIRGYHL